MHANELASFFPELELGEDDLGLLGYSFCHISVFDHWLSEYEAADNPVMSYSVALDSGEIDGYLQGEMRFLKLYSFLSNGGVVCNRPGPQRLFEVFTSELEQIVVDSLREKKLMDVYFKGSGVRVIGRYDRTDLVIADSPSHLNLLLSRVNEFGIFGLN